MALDRDKDKDKTVFLKAKKTWTLALRVLKNDLWKVDIGSNIKAVQKGNFHLIAPDVVWGHRTFSLLFCFPTSRSRFIRQFLSLCVGFYHFSRARGYFLLGRFLSFRILTREYLRDLLRLSKLISVAKYVTTRHPQLTTDLLQV